MALILPLAIEPLSCPMPILSVRHVTTYRYRQPVAFGEHRITFRPRDSYDQRLIEASIAIVPEPASLHWVHDVFGNCVAVARFAGRAEELRFDCRIRLDHTPINALDFQLEDHARRYPFAYGAEDIPDLTRSIERQYLDPNREIDHWVRRFLRQSGRTGTQDLLASITKAIHSEFTYVARSEKGVQDPLSTLRLGRGSCRDFSVLMMEAARSLGLAARFVSGYLCISSREGAGHVGGGATHAWVQVYLPGAGWVEFDPTNGIIGNRDLIRVAIARDPRQAVPLHGTWMGFPGDDLGMTVEVSVASHENAAAGLGGPAEGGGPASRTSRATDAPDSLAASGGGVPS
jgi:transglutaminase-like putative cysteine protease